MSVYRQSHMSDTSFKCLFDAYKKRLFGYVLTLSHSPYMAEEVTQEIFMKLWICRDKLHEVENMDGYVFAIARNQIINHLRRAACNCKMLEELQHHAVPAGNNVEAHTADAEYQKLLQEAITLLSPQRRIVYQLSRNNGMNLAEIASQLRLSRNTVKNHLADALRLIRAHLGRYSLSMLLFVVLFPFL